MSSHTSATPPRAAGLNPLRGLAALLLTLAARGGRAEAPLAARELDESPPARDADAAADGNTTDKQSL
jgi:hypothetical protein